MINQSETRDILQKLIETCRDGQDGFREAAGLVKNSSVKSYFQEQSLERGRFVGELENELNRLGQGDVNRSGSTVAALHRAWIDLKAKVGTGDEGVIAAAESGEDNAKKNYEEALKKELPLDILNIIQRQAQSVFAAHNRVRELRDSKAA